MLITHAEYCGFIAAMLEMDGAGGGGGAAGGLVHCFSSSVVLVHICPKQQEL